MRKPRVSESSNVGLFEAGLLVGLLGAIFWFMKEHSGEGRDLWPALGFPYGPTGNLAGIGGQFFTGNITGASPTGAALPVVLTPPQNVPKSLTDTAGSVLTDKGGTGLTDVTGTLTTPGLVPSFNAAALKIGSSGSGRDWPALPLDRGAGR